MSTRPPPPPGSERRRHPRHENLFASVQIFLGDETLVMAVKNLSLGGVALSAEPASLAAFAIGSHFDTMIFDASDENVSPVRVRGQVVRLDREGLALMWSDTDPAIAGGLVRLLESLLTSPPRSA